MSRLTPDLTTNYDCVIEGDESHGIPNAKTKVDC